MSSDKPLPSISNSSNPKLSTSVPSSSSTSSEKRPQNPILTALSDPSSSIYTQREVSSTVFDLLLIEMNFMLQDLTRKQMIRLFKERFQRDPNNNYTGHEEQGTMKLFDDESDGEPLDECAQEMLEELEADIQEVTCEKMEFMGWQVGQRISEKLTRDRPRFSLQSCILASALPSTAPSQQQQPSTAMLEASLEVVKFVCKDFWTVVTRKPIDNLKTNHRGVFVLQDNQFKWMSAFAPLNQLPSSTIEQVKPILSLACGLLRGGLFALGLDSKVTADMQYSNQCSFRVELVSQPPAGR